MKTHRNDTRLETIDQIEVFLSATQTLEFIIEDKTERDKWIQCTLRRFSYQWLSKADKCWVMQYLAKITGRLRKPLRICVRLSQRKC